MPCQVVDLFACWRGQFDRFKSVVVWKMISDCLMWCIRRERNGRSFEDCARKVVGVKRPSSSKLFTNGQLSMIVFIFLVFLTFLILFLFLVKCFSCILPTYLGCALPLF
jgi:hypothetical protein